MTYPIKNIEVVGQGLARLTSAYITQPLIRAQLAAYLQPQQELENVTFDVLSLRFLKRAIMYSPAPAAPPNSNVVFDILAELVGAPPRGALTDAQLKSLILLEVAVNRGTGRTTDWSKFAAILAPYISGSAVYLDGDNADFYFGLWNLQLDANMIGGSLTKAVPNGVYGMLAYSTWPDGNDFEWSSTYDSTAGEGVWGSAYDPTVGGLMVAAIPMVPEPNGGTLIGFTP